MFKRLFGQLRKPVVSISLGLIILVETLSQVGIVHPVLVALKQTAQAVVSVVGVDTESK